MSTTTTPTRTPSRNSLTARDTVSSISASNTNNHDANQEIMFPSSRPMPGRKDTDAILSYYQSEDAGQAYTAEHAQSMSINTRECRRRMSNASSPSEYSPDTDEESNSKSYQPASTHKPKASSQVLKRLDTTSEGSSDRRRLTTIDMGLGLYGKADRGKASSTIRNGSVRSKRDTDQLASAAPSDAPQTTYANLTPPSTASVVPEKAYSEATSQNQISAGLHRSSSSATTSSTGNKLRHSRKSSRNIVIVGTSGSTATNQSQDPLQSPIFQIPQSRSPSPKAVSQLSLSDSRSPRQRGLSLKEEYISTMSILDPDIEEEKSIHQLASPVSASSIPNTPHTAHPARTQSPTKTSPRRKPSPDATLSISAYPSPPFSPEMPSSYLQYQPGIHATAGPLPPPPRPTFTSGSVPPPRPPRINSPVPSTNRSRGDVSSVKQILQLPGSTKDLLKSKLSNASFSDTRSNSSKSEAIHSHPSPKSAVSGELPPVAKSAHIREGAFSPSTESGSLSSITVKSSMDDQAASGLADDVNANEVHPTVVEPPRKSEDSVQSNSSKKDDNWISVAPEDIPRVVTPTSDEGRAMSADSNHVHINIFRRSLSRSPPKAIKEIGDDVSPSSTPRHLRSTLSVNLKRFSSLPRPPSLWSEKRLSTGSRSSNASSISTLPPPPEVTGPPRTPPPIRKIISPWPAAMSYSDVISKKSSLERSLGYATKINELYIHDCGLAQFMMEIQYRGSNNSKRETLGSSGPRRPSTAPDGFQPRQVSRSSMTSEVTFPRRADTTTATDLSYSNKGDVSPPLGPPPLPYPSLAQPAPPANSRKSTNTSLSSSSSAQTLASPSSSGKSSSGFFSSLGRKASMKKERSGLSSSQSSSRLQKPTVKTNPIPRPINIPNAPTVPGGPRAAPNRISRSQTIMLPKPPPSPATSRGSNSISRRPSLFTAKRHSPEAPVVDDIPVINIEQDPEFLRQVAKLSDLLPHVDKEVLAAYLRRTGSDLIAIGQYLEDEKNGTIRLD